MNLFTIAWKSVKQRALASSLTALSVALGVMLMSSVLVLHGIIKRTFSQDTFGYDLIVGPKGSDLQLVLSSVYRIQPPIENLHYKYYLQLKANKKIEVAVPIALGDNSQKGNFPIVGTTGDYFTNDYAYGKSFLIRGEALKKPLDTIIGSAVARKNGWDIGSQFQITHGGQEEDVHDEKFTVVGILKKTGTPNDKTIFILLQDLLEMEGHEQPVEEGLDKWLKVIGKSKDDFTAEELNAFRHDPDIAKEVTSVFVKFKRRIRSADASGVDNSQAQASQLAFQFQQKLKEGHVANAVNPVIVMDRLLKNIVGNIQLVLMILISLIIVVAGLSIFVSIYNSMTDRRKEIAIMRALGARRTTVFSIILSESILLCVGGGFAGFLLGHLVVLVASPFVESASGLLIDPFAFEMEELYLIPAMVLLASLVGFIPGLTAYRTDVAKALGD